MPSSLLCVLFKYSNINVLFRNLSKIGGDTFFLYNYIIIMTVTRLYGYMIIIAMTIHPNGVFAGTSMGVFWETLRTGQILNHCLDMLP